MPWRRWIIIAAVLIVCAAVLMLGASILVHWLIPIEEAVATNHMSFSTRPPDLTVGSAGWWTYCAAPTLFMLASQAAFLLPVVRQRPVMGSGKSLCISMIGVALVAALLTSGVVLSLVWLAFLVADRDAGDYSESQQVLAFILQWPILILLTWLFWSALLIVFARRRAARGRWSRFIGLVFSGTIIELLIVVPIDVMVRRKTDCYCQTGTFHALCFAAFGLVWLTGPGVVIALTSKRRRLWRETHCEMCGYAKGPTPGARCPECGFEWGPGRGEGRT